MVGGDENGVGSGLGLVDLWDKAAVRLKQDMRAGEELPLHSVEEVEIRAATIAIADAVVARANSRNGELGLSAAKFDYWCWRKAVAAEEEGLLAMLPFHRTRTTDY